MGRSQVKARSTASLDNIYRSSCQSHQDLIPNMLVPSIDLLFKNTSTSLSRLLGILAFPPRTYTIWTNRVVSRVVERKEHVKNTSIHAVHVQSTSTGVQILNLLLLLNVFWQMERISGLDLSLKVSNMTQSGLKPTATSYKYCLLDMISLTDARLVIALVFLQMDGQMTFYALNGLRSPSFPRLLYGILRESQFFSSTMVMDPIIQQSSSTFPEPIISFCSASHLPQPTNYNPLTLVYLAHISKTRK